MPDVVTAASVAGGNFFSISGTALSELGIRFSIGNDEGHLFHDNPYKSLGVTVSAGAFAIDVNQGLIK